MPCPAMNCTGPIWSKKMKGPTIWRCACGKRAAHLEAAEIAGARHDDEVERVAGLLVAQ